MTATTWSSGCWHRGGEVEYFIHNTLPFGASSAPYQFARVANALTSLAQSLFPLPVQNYLDDFWGLMPASVVQAGFKTFKAPLTMLGFKMKAAKQVSPTDVGPLLGVEVDLRENDIVFRVDPIRKEALLREKEEILSADVISPGQAAKLAGKLIFAACALTGRVGRAFLQPLFRLANLQRVGRSKDDEHAPPLNADGTLSHRMRMALKWWAVLLRDAPPRGVLPPPPRPRFEAWTDAALVPWGLGGVLTKSGSLSSTRFFGVELGGRLGRWLPSAARQTQVIFQLELLAVLLLLRLWGPTLKGSALRVFVDNEGARCSIISGYTSNPWGARIVAQIWVEVARLDLSLWVERVPTKENPADFPSRGKYAIARRLRWREEGEAAVDMEIEVLEAVLDRDPQLLDRA